MVINSPVFVVCLGLAGAAGALARYLVGLLTIKYLPPRFPWGTMLINISGALAIGFLAGLVSAKALNTTLQTVLATGFLGGYTTFSTMSWEAVQLLRSGKRLQSVLYLVGNVVPGLLAATLGLILGGLF